MIVHAAKEKYAMKQQDLSITHKALCVLLVLLLLSGVGATAVNRPILQSEWARVFIQFSVHELVGDSATNFQPRAVQIAIYRNGSRVETVTTSEQSGFGSFESDDPGTYTARLILPVGYSVYEALMYRYIWSGSGLIQEARFAGTYAEFSFEARDTLGLLTHADIAWDLFAGDSVFTDVRPGQWFHDAVSFVHENSIMTGTGTRTFSPNATLSRATVATVLYRMAGSPAVTFAPEFRDVQSGRWYSNAVIWAANHGIVEGFGGRFAPDGNITREQLAVMLHRYARHMDYNMSDTALGGFPDTDTVSGWATEAMRWAVHHRLIQGDGGNLNPRGTATRAQCATILMRMIQTFA